MSDLFQAWPARKPSPGFAERVANEARREHVARMRARRIGGAVIALGLAAAGVVLVKAHLAQSLRTAIRPDEPSVAMPWPLTTGWDEGAFRFPLVFAPDIPYRGAVRIHLTPEFASPGKPGYWGIVAVWLTDSDGTAGVPDPRRLERDLRAYYTGLCGTNGHPGTHTRAPHWESQSAHLSPVPLAADERALGRTAELRGDVDALDCIVNGGELSLNVEAVAGTCASGTAYVAYVLSPRPLEDPIWDALRAERRAFDCRPR